MRRLREFDGQRRVVQARRRCSGCRRAVTEFDERVAAPRFLHSRDVIARALTARQHGLSREAAAAACTADRQVDPALVKRWEFRFWLIEGGLVEVVPPMTPSRGPSQPAILAASAGSRSPDLQQEDPWARSPPPQL